MNSFCLFADADWIRLLVPLVMFGIYAFNRWMAMQKAARAAPPRRPSAARPQAPEAPQPAKPAPRPKNTLSNEIDQFLKEAAERKRAQTRHGQGPSQAKVPTSATTTTKSPSQSPRVLTQSPAPESTASQGVAASVEQHLDIGDFEKRAASLGDDIQRADLVREEHFKKTFTQKLGTLDDTSANTTGSNADASAETVASVGLTAMLADPKNLRRAIILHEILDRPEHRW